jgi:hypothetical protein
MVAVPQHRCNSDTSNSQPLTPSATHTIITTKLATYISSIYLLFAIAIV